MLPVVGRFIDPSEHICKTGGKGEVGTKDWRLFSRKYRGTQFSNISTIKSEIGAVFKRTAQ